MSDIQQTTPSRPELSKVYIVGTFFVNTYILLSYKRLVRSGNRTRDSTEAALYLEF